MTAAESAPVICTGFKSYERGTLKGFADIYLRSMRVTIKGCAVHEKNGRRWVQLPARPQLDKNRELIRDDSGKIQYATMMEWDSREIADRFSEAAAKAIDNFNFKSDFGA